MPVLRWKERAEKFDAFGVVRATWGRNRLPGMHTHDFAEIFWLEQGACDHHVNGHLQVLAPGDLVFVRAEDNHRLAPHRGQPFTFTNLSFPLTTLREWLSRYPDELGPHYPPLATEPCRLSLGPAAGQVSAAALDLAERPHTRFYLDQFLLGLLALTLPRRAPDLSADAPGWLRDACLRLQEPEVYSAGVAGFVRVAGRCPEHVSRSTRRHLGFTPRELVGKVRMRAAARDLKMTDKSVAEIAAEVGYANPAQFYEAFKAQHGMTPRAYRVRQRR